MANVAGHSDSERQSPCEKTRRLIGFTDVLLMVSSPLDAISSRFVRHECTVNTSPNLSKIRDRIKERYIRARNMGIY